MHDVNDTSFAVIKIQFEFLYRSFKKCVCMLLIAYFWTLLSVYFCIQLPTAVYQDFYIILEIAEKMADMYCHTEREGRHVLGPIKLSAIDG